MSSPSKLVHLFISRPEPQLFFRLYKSKSSFAYQIRWIGTEIKWTRHVSSMIHSARPNVSPVVNIVFAWHLFCFEKWNGRTYGRMTCAKTMITIGRDCGAAKWIKKYGFLDHFIAHSGWLWIFHLSCRFGSLGQKKVFDIYQRKLQPSQVSAVGYY